MTPPKARRTIRLLALAMCLALGVTAGTQALAASSPRAATKACSPGKYPGDGYFTTLSVKGVSCSTGHKLEVAYYKCRMRNGGRKGKCPASTKVNNFSCKETNRTVIPTEINAKVTCKKGSATIIHTYQQNLQ